MYDAKGLVTGSSALAHTDVTSALGAESITDNMIVSLEDFVSFLAYL